MDITHCVVVLIIARSLSYHLCEDFKEERGRSKRTLLGVEAVGRSADDLI